MTTDPDTLVDLTSARSEFEASMIVEALKARDIPAFTFSNAGMTLQWEVAATNPFRVSVRCQDVEKAKEILRAIKAESVDIDWSEVDVGQRQDSIPAAKPGASPEEDEQRRITGWIVLLLLLAALFWILWSAFARAPD
ncbi:MAG: DUF2007 domain-containing protein [Phycisphaeraceae bacterium]|nr:DUF2007 domain-containing protein [Phycisphaeraceae bacterium]